MTSVRLRLASRRLLRPPDVRGLRTFSANSKARLHGATAVILAGVGLAAASGAAYIYWHKLSPYPEEGIFPASPVKLNAVSKHLRLALYYAEHAVDYPRAICHYNDAIQAAHDHNLDPRADTTAGIHIKLAFLYKSLGRYGNARTILESLLADAQRPASAQDSNRLTARAVRLAVSLADIAMCLKDYKAADDHFHWAIHTLLLHRAQNRHLLPTEETIALMATAAEYFRETNRPILAAPLFLKALDMINPPNCTSAHLMNSIAATISGAGPDVSDSSTFAQRQESAKSWAEKAIQQAKNVPRQLKDQTCNQTCATANINLAIIADILNDRNEAIVRLQDAKVWAKKCFNIDINEQVKQLEQRLNYSTQVYKG
ncbi:TPR repeat-containing protein [Neolecta irregularis DAH-3]|uniref:TPR repeat-containing protein n=1 Tax=Neolecta irregularis (strain DAH-3) TaxID=1198029 RepID=A0A1U7LN88_NEOID|nr:TPR repeat-containing protein [Neolecta irregularis DAH-3]|eukprot:OLL23991.1 TPR repeat-containing protein [Neolecta irregularis DAH-3]